MMPKNRPLLIAASVAALALSACGTGVIEDSDVAAAALTSNGWTTSASASTVAAGSTVNVNVQVKAAANISGLVDLEIYAPSGSRVGQQAWDGQSFTANVQRTFTYAFKVPASPTSGTYTLKVGIFKPGWAGQYQWNNGAGSFQVTSSPPPVVDAGAPPRDAGTPTPDAGTPPHDAGTPPSPDAGTPNPTCSEQSSWRGTSGFAPLADSAARARICTRAETRPLNASANAYVPSTAELQAFLGTRDQNGNSNASSNPYVSYVTGGCGGAGRTTDEIIQCTAAKWGIPADWLRAEYVIESNWEHIDPRTGKASMGDKNYVGTTKALGYPDFSREKDASGNLTGYVWQSLGLTQVRFNPDGSVGTGTEPLRWKSTAFNADYQGCLVRFYYDNPQGLRSSWGDSSYGAGQDWWSIGGWFNPYPWQNSGQASYVNSVKGVLANRTWEKAGF